MKLLELAKPRYEGSHSEFCESGRLVVGLADSTTRGALASARIKSTSVYAVFISGLVETVLVDIRFTG